MVKSANDFQYGNLFFKEGNDLPDGLVKILELKNPSLLDNYIELNGRWIKITDPIISGFVEERKNSELRLKRFFSSKSVSEKQEDPESQMLKTHPEKPKEVPKQPIKKGKG